MSGAGKPAAAEVLRIAPVTGIRDSAALKQELLALLDVSAPVAIDATAVERTDTAVLQLLHAFERDRVTRGAPVTWSGRSAAFAQAAATLGLPSGDRAVGA